VKDKFIPLSVATANQKNRFKGNIVSKGEFYLANDNGERKGSGAYYTPDYIVDYVCNETLAPLCEGKNTEEILALDICDPTMGSAHFLLGTVKYLEKAINEYQSKNKFNSPAIHHCLIKIQFIVC